MAMGPWGEPFRDVVSLRDAMNSLLQESFVRAGAGGGPSTLPLDVIETPDEFVIRTSLPGLRPEDVQITARGNTVTIRGETRPEPADEGVIWRLRERRFGAFERTVSLASPIDSSKAHARYDLGVLTLRLPKAEQARPRQIKVGG